MKVEKFAEREYRDHVVYQELERVETVPAFKRVLQQLVKHELKDFNFWVSLAQQKTFVVNPWHVKLYVAMRKVMGLTFTVRFLERHERQMIQVYTAFAEGIADPELKKRVEAAIDHARRHERRLISQIDEERVRFIGNTVLGLNDALITMSGALVGFSFAFRNNLHTGHAGVIMGVAAGLSIAASAFLQARYQQGKNAIKAALYSGIAFMIVVAVLCAPFYLVPGMAGALIAMAVIIAALLAMTSFYTSVVFERPFLRQASTMFLFSAGVAAVTFMIGAFI